MKNRDDFVAHIDRLAKKINFKLTEKRVYILYVLYENALPLSAKDIVAQVNNRYNNIITISSVRKFISLLGELNVLHVLYLPPYRTKYYSLKHLRSQNYLICMKCGNITLFFDEIMEQKIKERLDKKNFLLTNHRVLLLGLCKECNNE